jgi:hypothetical protein
VRSLPVERAKCPSTIPDEATGALDRGECHGQSATRVGLAKPSIGHVSNDKQPIRTQFFCS